MPTANPRTGQIDYQMPVYSAEQVEAIAQRLRAAQPSWFQSGVEFRLEALRAFGAAIKNEREALLQSLSADTGRWNESVIEVDSIVSVIERWATDAPALLMDAVPRPSSQVGKVTVVQRQQPFVLTGVISPWNFPLLLSLIDAVPALLAGSAVLIKPSEVTPRFVVVLDQIIEKIPALASVLKIVTGAGSTGEALVRNVDVLCFTGSVKTGQRVGRVAAECFIPAHLELGGKDPAIVCADADVDLAARALAWGSMVNGGQACMSIERCYVDVKIQDAFLAALSREVGALKLNDADIQSGQIGPIISQAQVSIIQRHLDDAYARGAKALVGGHVVQRGGGYWCEPTVLVNVTQDMAVIKEETFAAVLPIFSFSDEEEAIRMANDTEFGLSACVFSRDVVRAQKIAGRLEAGGVSVNDASLTGLVQDAEKQSFKSSGLGGSRMGKASLSRFYRQQAILVGDGNPSPWWFAPA